MHPLVLSAQMEAPILVEIAVAAEGSKLEDRLPPVERIGTGYRLERGRWVMARGALGGVVLRVDAGVSRG